VLNPVQFVRDVAESSQDFIVRYNKQSSAKSLLTFSRQSLSMCTEKQDRFKNGTWHAAETHYTEE